MPLCREIRATKYVAGMMALGVKVDQNISVEEACRRYARIQRGATSKPYGQPLAALIANSTKRRRAKITHPGKRGRR